ncbi:Amidohydrolase 3 [Candidatus Koribacter versatilis Ellin345]|uniref:Amidohydrolase 3 n=1 Tax=Koribacter versatilis (strain Ellin345) TaxID=204669 RepID=Q1IL06_KORVE|nr:amidohydrolase [Candidatus Koribacter versatilis]ABF42444.1 Amidohydrolase 3 [Candidatus Koribacter versatilis Ellin345]
MSLRRSAFLLLMLSFTACFAEERPSANTIITNAHIYTVDANHPTAESVAILGDKIVAVGTNAEIDAWRGEKTQVIDGRGHLLLPGFNDAHVHFVPGGQQLDSINLREAATPEAFKQTVADRVKKTAKGEWITGGDWDEQKWNPAVLPTKELIDAVSPETPVFVTRYDGHISLANSYALKLAGITAKTKAPAGGEIVRDKSGNPTGVLKDAAQGLMYAKIPDLTHDQRVRAAKRALAHAASVGVTSVQDMNPSYADIAVYSELAEKGELTTRIYAAPMLEGWNDFAKIGVRRAWGSPYLRFGAMKTYADGSLGATTAYFFEPYTDAPNSRGLLSEEMHPISAERERLIKADAAHLQICAHAIGDAGISTMLDLFQDVVKANGTYDRRWRIEHSQHLAEKDFQRYADLGVIASVQPYHAIDDGRFAEKRIGSDRIKRTYAFRTFLDNHVRLAFGTDWTVAPLAPMWTIYAAVTRATLDGKNPDGWVPEQKLKVSEAVEAYTMGSAYAEFQENVKGSITVGKYADMVLLSDDIFKIQPAAIKDVQVEVTMVGGKITYRK